MVLAEEVKVVVEDRRLYDCAKRIPIVHGPTWVIAVFA